jgi:hypothetical protein
MFIGGLIGFVIGVAQIIAIGSWKLFYWGFMPLIPLCSALGWSLLGMIIGGSGLFSKETVEIQNESQNYPMDTAA